MCQVVFNIMSETESHSSTPRCGGQSLRVCSESSRAVFLHCFRRLCCRVLHSWFHGRHASRLRLTTVTGFSDHDPDAVRSWTFIQIVLSRRFTWRRHRYSHFKTHNTVARGQTFTGCCRCCDIGVEVEVVLPLHEDSFFHHSFHRNSKHTREISAVGR